MQECSYFETIGIIIVRFEATKPRMCANEKLPTENTCSPFVLLFFVGGEKKGFMDT